MPKFDLVVFGKPRTSQSKSKKTWQTSIRNAVRAQWPSGQPLLLGELSARIVYFFEDSTPLDVDNIIKPILDSLKELVYEDDSTIFQVTSRKTPLLRRTMLNNAPALLVEALAEDRELVFVRITQGLNHEELPI